MPAVYSGPSSRGWRTLRTLRGQAAAGGPAPHEYDRRVEAALGAATRGALRVVSADLPDPAANRSRLTVRSVVVVVVLAIVVLCLLFAVDVAAGGPSRPAR